MVKAIIPAAGYGLRMNMAIDKSKEMLIDPVTGKYLIDYSLDLCYSNKIEPVVISRIEKEDLNSYLRSKGVEHIILKKPGKEWAETVLKSQGLWGEKNILLLPDTRFEYQASVDILLRMIQPHQQLAIGYHEIDPQESHKWGTINEYGIYEKQGTLFKEAWGLLAFSKYSGNKLFNSLNPEGTFLFNQLEQCTVNKLKLNSFVDITRTGKLEKY